VTDRLTKDVLNNQEFNDPVKATSCKQVTRKQGSCIKELGNSFNEMIGFCGQSDLPLFSRGLLFNGHGQQMMQNLL